MLARREKNALIIAAIIYAVVFLFATFAPSKDKVNQFLADWELVLLIIVVTPLGFYIATDPERTDHKE